MKFFCTLFCLFILQLDAAPFSQLSQTVSAIQSPFYYDLKVKLLKGHSENENVMLLLHGMGSDNRIADVLQSYGDIPDHLISFNFPDSGFLSKPYDPRMTSFGSIQEIFPVLYLLKKLVVDGGLTSINLYGFSAGGGAAVNTLRVLNTDTYDKELASLGIDQRAKQAILQALQNGVILLDAPLKSIPEIIALRGSDENFNIIGARYRKNDFEPIDAIKYWQGLVLNVLVYFEKPDAILSNRDDALFMERIRAVNPKGVVEGLEGNYGGHVSYHTALWKAYLSLTASRKL